MICGFHTDCHERHYGFVFLFPEVNLCSTERRSNTERDPSSSLPPLHTFPKLRRWFLGRMEARRRVKHRIFLHRAAVAIQSFARVASARTRCSILRAERRRFWVDRARALWDAHDAVNAATSPAAEELLQGLDAPPLPPPQKSESCRQHTPGSEPYRIGRGREMAEALSPTIVGPPPPGCPAPLKADWGEWGVKLKLAFAS